MTEDINFLREKLMSTVKPKGSCMSCDLPAMPKKRRCAWHLEAAAPPDVRAAEALKRRQAWDGQRKRSDGSCAGCGATDVPTWYRTGARCKSCAILDRRSQQFGLSTEQQIAMEKLSGGRCMLCGNQQKKVALSVDHSHSTGEVRGILCGRGGTSCNETLGWWFDDARRFLAAAIYLISPPARRIGIGPAPLTEDELVVEIGRIVREIVRGDI